MAKAKKLKLDCNAPVGNGISLVFLTRFNEMIEWRNAALDWSDPEGVHSMRVASRRLRSVMRDFLPYLPKKSFSSSIKQLRTLAAGLGEVRDLDVAIMALEELEKKAPAEHAAALKQLIAERKDLREHQRRELKTLLAKRELKTLQTEFVAAVEAAATNAAERKRKPLTPPSFAKVSHEIIRDRLKEFEKRSNGLFRPLDVNALHDLRIATKRLRYAIELLAACFPRSLSANAKRAARLQTALGDLHDCDSWILSIGDEIVRARKERAVEQVAALTWLLNHFARVRTKHLHCAFARWREWEAHGSSDKVRQALDDRKSIQQETPVAEEISTQPEVAEPQELPPPESTDQVAGEQMRQAL